MYVKSKSKNVRKVLIEKTTVSLDVFNQSLMSLTDDCKILYHPKYKCRFFLEKDKNIFMSVLTKKDNYTIVITRYALTYLAMRYYNIHRLTVIRKTGLLRVMKAKLTTVARNHGYYITWVDRISNAELVYLEKKSGVVLKTGSLWFAHN